MKRPSPARLVLVGVVLAGVGLDMSAPATLAGAPSHKTFQASVSSDNSTWVTSLPIAAGSVSLYFRVANTSSGPQGVPYGSFQLPVPTGISVSTASIVNKPITFNNPTVNTSTSPATVTITSNGPTGTGIAPGSSLTVLVTGTATSGVCPGTWAIHVKQSNDFSGTGNDFTGNSVDTPVAGGTKLVWTVQPPVATEYDADMSPQPQATLEDGCGNTITNFTGSATLTDADGVLTPQPFSVSVTAADAVFTFPGVRFTDYSLTDTLTATVGTVSATSNEFDIFQLVKPCDAGKSCTSGTLTGKNGTTLANIVADIGVSSDVLTVNIKGTATGSCNGTTTEPPLGENVTLNVADRTKSVTVTLPKTYVNQIPNNGTPFMDICLDVTPDGTPFFDKRHYADPINFPTATQVGLLADCSVTANVRPCIASRKKNQANEIIQVNLPAGDPQLHWM